MGYSKFHKRRDFFFSYDNQGLLGVISQYGLPFWTLKEMSPFPLQFGEEENIPEHPIESRAYWFILKIARMFPILTSRNRMMNTFVIVNINPTYKRWFKGNVYAFPFKKRLPFPFSLTRNRIYFDTPL